MTLKAIIWSKPNCEYCKKAKLFLKYKNIPFEERDITKDWTVKDLLKAVPNAKTVPQIFLNNKHIGGYEDTYKHITNLDRLNVFYKTQTMKPKNKVTTTIKPKIEKRSQYILDTLKFYSKDYSYDKQDNLSRTDRFQRDHEGDLADGSPNIEGTDYGDYYNY